MKRALAVAFVAAVAAVSSAHVGSPDVYFSGRAGAYDVRVVVRTPGVVPGRAEVLVQSDAPGIARITVRPVYWDAGTGGAPAPDTARRVSGQPGLYRTQLWLMTGGSYSMLVHVDGAAGPGDVNVPVLSLATRRLPMPGATAKVLVALGAFLVFGLLSIIAAAAREGTLAPGLAPDRARRRRAKLAVFGGAALLVLVLAGGKAWWDDADRTALARLYRPLHIRTAVQESAGVRGIAISIPDTSWTNRHAFTPLIADHGKLMHLFLIRDSAMDAFAHLHPTTRDSNSFVAALPPLPVGRYRVYADIVHESGFSETLVDTVRLTSNDARVGAGDPDDSWHAGAPTGDTARLADGSTMIWRRDSAPIVAGAFAPLRFEVRAPDGSAAELEPYMGMAAHAMLARDDGGVFVHLHPMGTIAMAAQAVFDARERGASRGGPSADQSRTGPREMMQMSDASARPPGVVDFPYAFPSAGRYRIWVQLKRGGRVLTGVFDARVNEAPRQR